MPETRKEFCPILHQILLWALKKIPYVCSWFYSFMTFYLGQVWKAPKILTSYVFGMIESYHTQTFLNTWEHYNNHIVVVSTLSRRFPLVIDLWPEIIEKSCLHETSNLDINLQKWWSFDTFMSIFCCNFLDFIASLSGFFSRRLFVSTTSSKIRDFKSIQVPIFFKPMLQWETCWSRSFWHDFLIH